MQVFCIEYVLIFYNIQVVISFRLFVCNHSLRCIKCVRRQAKHSEVYTTTYTYTYIFGINNVRTTPFESVVFFSLSSLRPMCNTFEMVLAIELLYIVHGRMISSM